MTPLFVAPKICNNILVLSGLNSGVNHPCSKNLCRLAISAVLRTRLPCSPVQAITRSMKVYPVKGTRSEDRGEIVRISHYNVQCATTSRRVQWFLREVGLKATKNFTNDPVCGAACSNTMRMVRNAPFHLECFNDPPIQQPLEELPCGVDHTERLYGNRFSGYSKPLLVRAIRLILH
ncbi:hypothetical protein J6590_092761 [Homalodisca vitripennis]|nr:hypothetical protein J6590_092761 [Homalodisca vitripennis]